MQKPKGQSTERRNMMLTNYLSTDPTAGKYTSKYRIKNVSELNKLCIRGKTD